MAFTRIGELLLKRHITRKSSRGGVNAMLVLAAWPAILETTGCVEKFQRTRALSFKEGKLFVQVASNTIASELTMCEPQLKAAYAKRFKANIIDKIVVRRG